MDSGQIRSAINSDHTFKRSSIASHAKASSNRRKYVLVAVLTMLSLKAAVGSAAGASGPSSAAAAGLVYMNQCAQCHGKSGKGDGPRAAHLLSRVHSFADCDWMSMRSDAVLFLAIKNGSAAVGMFPEMPPFGGQLDDQQITNLIWYVRSFCTGKTQTGRGQ